MQVTLRVRRFDPETDKRPHMQSFVVEAEPTDQVLDLLNRVKDYQDGSLTYRRSCGHGICGSDAMRINGRNRLACKVLVRELGSTITVEPLMGLPVVKDLVVDLRPFFEHYKTVMPYLVNDEPAPARERLQTPAQPRELYAQMRKLAADNQELVFWSKAAPAHHRAGLDTKWRELALRIIHSQE